MTESVAVPDEPGFVRIILTGLLNALMANPYLEAVEPYNYDVPDEYLEPEQADGGALAFQVKPGLCMGIADDLARYAEGPSQPDLVQVAARMVILLMCRLETFDQVIEHIFVEALITLAELNNAIADVSDEQTLDGLRIVFSYVDPNESSQVAVLEKWIRTKLFPGADDGAWWSSTVELSPPGQLSFDDIIDSAETGVIPDDDLLAMLVPDRTQRRVFISGSMSNGSESLRALTRRAAARLAVRLRERGYFVHEPTSVENETRTRSAVEAVDFDHHASTDVLISFGHPDAMGTNILLGKAIHTNPYQVVLLPDDVNATPLIEHVESVGGTVIRYSTVDGLIEQVEQTLAGAREVIDARVERRLGYDTYRLAHDLLVTAIRAARTSGTLKLPITVSPWRVGQLERSIEHFAQAGLDELRALAEALDLPDRFRAEMAGLTLTTTAAHAAVMSEPTAQTLETDWESQAVISAAEMRTLFRMSGGEGWGPADMEDMVSYAQRRRVRELALALEERSRARLDEAGWAQVRRDAH